MDFFLDLRLIQSLSLEFLSPNALWHWGHLKKTSWRLILNREDLRIMHTPRGQRNLNAG